MRGEEEGEEEGKYGERMEGRERRGTHLQEVKERLETCLDCITLHEIINNKTTNHST